MASSSAVSLHCGDARLLLPMFEDASFDSIITDPPYELGLLRHRWDSTGVAYDVELWRQSLRVLKPGGHLLAFGAPRTYHRMACAVEDAGFEIRDSVHWIYGNGFPKGADVSKAIDRRRYDPDAVLRVTDFVRNARNRSGKTNAQIDALLGTRGMASHFTSNTKPAVPRLEQWELLKRFLGFGDEMDAEVARLCERKGKSGEAWEQRSVTGQHDEPAPADRWSTRYETGRDDAAARERRDEPATHAARTWRGWNTVLRPAHEAIVVARKPLVGGVVNNVLQFGTGAINLDGCRNAGGRLPANVMLDDLAAQALDESASVRGGASRFFYVARASPAERKAGLDANAPQHPTMKPIALMRQLVRLVTPRGGAVLDPFTGSGSTGIAALLEGNSFTGFERDPRYIEIAGARINHWKGESNEQRIAA